MKTCFKCHQQKPLDEFYTHPRMADGHLGKCKECTKRDVAHHIVINRFDPAWVMQERERCRNKSAKRRTLGLEKPRDKEVLKRWNERNKHKKNAHLMANRAQKRGILKAPPTCEGCDQQKPLQKHHPDYSQPLNVKWLCTACHGKVHRKHAPTI